MIAASEKEPVMETDYGASEQAGGMNDLHVKGEVGKSAARTVAEVTMSSITRNAVVTRDFADKMLGGQTGVNEALDIVSEGAEKVAGGDMEPLVSMLSAQITAMDAIFTEFARHSLNNVGHFPDAVERYMNLALKAQANCRVAAETISRIKRGGKQTVTVVHVNEGGQAVVAETFNHNRGGSGDQKGEQPHGQSEGAVAHAPVAALLSQEPPGVAVPLSRTARKEKVSAARR